MQLEHKASERSQQEITVGYLNLIQHYVDIIFVLPDLGTGQGLPLSWDVKTIWTLHKLT